MLKTVRPFTNSGFPALGSARRGSNVADRSSDTTAAISVGSRSPQFAPTTSAPASVSLSAHSPAEFPIIVRLDYKDRWGNDQFWTHGFYYQNWAGYPIAEDSWGRPAGEQVPRGVWYPFESGNLLELLGESGPVHVTGLTVYSSGWNYDSLVSEIQVIVE